MGCGAWRNSCDGNGKTGGREDYEQVQKILQGAADLWGELYENAYKKVHSCARQSDRARLLRWQDYDDITDEAFTRCYAHLERYRGESRFSTWVCGYAKNIARDRCARRLTRLRKTGHLEELARNQMAACDPYFVLLRCERDDCLWRAFFDLDGVDREIVQRRVLEDDAPGAIAGDLELTRKEVLRRFERAKAAMRRRYLHYYHHSSMGRE